MVLFMNLGLGELGIWGEKLQEDRLFCIKVITIKVILKKVRFIS